MALTEAPPTPTAPTMLWRRSRRGLLTLVSIEVLALAVTGVVLYFTYRPSSAQAWDDIYNLQAGDDGSVSIRGVHRWVSWALVPTAVAAAIAHAFGPRPPLRGVAGAVRAAGITVAPIAAIFTGFLVVWDQLALATVSAGTDVRGYDILFDDDVLFVLVDDVEVDPSTVLAWLGVHAGLGLGLVGLVASLWWAHRRTAPE